MIVFFNGIPSVWTCLNVQHHLHLDRRRAFKMKKEPVMLTNTVLFLLGVLPSDSSSCTTVQYFRFIFCAQFSCLVAEKTIFH